MKEVWLAVAWTGGAYEVSNKGRVRSVPRLVERASRYGGTRILSLKGKLLRPWLLGGKKKESRQKYWYVKLYVDGIKMDVAVHFLVLEAFVAPQPKGKICRHLNGDYLDNRPENLCWGTYKENAEDREKHGTTAKGAKNGRTKLKEKDIPKIRAMKSDKWGAMSKVAKKFGVNVATIRDIWVGRSWSHVK